MVGKPEGTRGGNALKVYGSVRIDIPSIGAVKDSEIYFFGRFRQRAGSSVFSPKVR
ncbi:hypothetical protein [Escherichia coli]|uniref:hypothetical protein n=1 Tax=Escherichia coli TaxID=562 RepID=UPI0035BC27D9